MSNTAKPNLEDLLFSLQSPDMATVAQAARLLLACMVVRSGGCIVDTKLLEQVTTDATALDFEVLRGGELAVTLRKR